MYSIQLNDGQELTILANWLKGHHREDIDILDADLFRRRNIYAAARAGDKTILQLMAEKKNDGVNASDLERAFDNNGVDFSEALYQDAKTAAIVTQRDKLADEIRRPGADVPAITDKLLQIQAIINKREAKPAAVNLAETFLKSLEKDAAKQRMKYGRGFEDLDRRAGSIERGRLIVLGARPATGKSAAALQIAYNVAAQGAKVLFFPLEMTTQETLYRLILQQQIVSSAAELKAMNENEKARVVAFLDRLEKDGKLLFYEGVNNLETIEQIVKEQQPDLVVIDQLTQITTARKTKDIRERYIEVTARLKHLALERDTAILLLSQLNRAATEKNRPTLETLHESDATGQNADVVLLMTKEDDEENETWKKGGRIPGLDDIRIFIVKNRQGESGRMISQKFYGERFTFSGVEKSKR